MEELALPILVSFSQSAILGCAAENSVPRLVEGEAQMTTNILYEILDLNDEVVYRVRAVDQPPLPPAPTGAVLQVPWVSQLGPGADYASGDCGPACTTMWLHYYGLTNLTVNDCSSRTGLAPGYRYTMPAHLMNIMRAYGYETVWRDGLGISELIDEIESDNPCILLVEYDQLPMALRYDKGYQYGHWILIVGHNSSEMIYHDPYFPSTAGGADIRILDDALLYAWGHNSDSGNRNYQAIRLRG